jgi:hypothetical protein
VFIRLATAEQRCIIDESRTENIALGGGGWQAMRYVPGWGKWYKATDFLAGTEVYGTPFCTTDEWSAEFQSKDFD